MHQFKFKDAGRPTAAAQKVGEALEEIGASDPDSMVHAARVVECAETDDRLHGYFEWDDATAGHKYRLTQARDLVRSIEVVHIPANEDRAPKEVEVSPAYVQLRSDGEGYRPTQVVLSDAQLRASLLTQARQDFAAYRRRYERLTALAKGFEAMERALLDAMEEPTS